MTFVLPHFPHRLVAAREAAGMTQAVLAGLLGFKDRQTLSSLESGLRRVTAEELVAIAEATRQTLDFFTDPFRLVGEGRFSYRASGTEEKELDAYEEKVRSWLAVWTQLGERRRETASLLRPRLAIHLKSTFEEAQQAGEAVGRELKLGDVPGEKLINALEEQFKLLLLHVDMPKGVSGAAVQLSTGDAILINRAEPSTRRAFDLAHELFHVLTWDALPPQRVDRESPTANHQKRTEQLADNFAAALLMPLDELKPRWDRLGTGNALKDRLRPLADHFGVSEEAIGWRTVTLGWITKHELKAVPPPKKRPSAKSGEPALFSRRFMERAVWGIDRGELSVRRLLDLLDLDLEAFRACGQAHGLKVNIGL